MRSIGHIALIEQTATQQRDLHSFQIAGSYAVSKSAVAPFLLSSRPGIKMHAIFIDLSAQRKLAGVCRSNYARNVLYLFQRLRIKTARIVVIVKLMAGCLDLHGQQMIRVK